ncbi:MAG TPA: EfeM/EfeO family lipoprotein [Solirubrobacteraceae bacterium]|nr:EfeM/EfeO family lipoprotein [Solirubrobacteraceae bacterium]
MAVWLAGVAGLAIVAVIAAAVIPGSHSSAPRFSTLAVASHGSTANQLHVRVKAVFGSDISAQKYGTQISQRENGIGPGGQIASDLDPLPANSFDRPVAEYLRYAVGVSGQLGTAVSALTARLESGDRAAAQRAWNVAFTDYLHLGAVYGLLPGDLNDRLAQIPTDLDETHFTGLHRVEKGLWQGAPLRSLVPISRAISAAIPSLKQTLPTTQIDPIDYAARGHEILEDAQRDLMSGNQVPWSGEGVLGTAAGITATREVVRTLAPLMQGRDNTLVQVDNWLVTLQSTFRTIRRPDGTYPTLDQLTIAQRERINGSLAGALSALEEIPGTVETVGLPDIPTIAGQEHQK